MDILGKRLKELREERNISLNELAKILNVSNASISYWENNINEPKATHIRNICNYFNICADYLLGRQDWY